MKQFGKWMAKAIGVFAIVAAFAQGLAAFEHKMLDGIEPRKSR